MTGTTGANCRIEYLMRLLYQPDWGVALVQRGCTAIALPTEPWSRLKIFFLNEIVIIPRSNRIITFTAVCNLYKFEKQKRKR